MPATPDAIRTAAERLRAGRLVAFPTETVYGLGADARNAIAVAGIFAAKGRPRFNPLIVHVPDLAGVEAHGRLTPLARTLAEAFWPGPMTLVLERTPTSTVCDLATAGLDTLGLRVPSHPVARALLEASGVPIAAPSANRSGGRWQSRRSTSRDRQSALARASTPPMRRPMSPTPRRCWPRTRAACSCPYSPGRCIQHCTACGRLFRCLPPILPPHRPLPAPTDRARRLKRGTCSICWPASSTR